MVSTGPDAFFARIGKNAVVNVGVLPASATVLKKLATEFDVAGLAKMAGVVYGGTGGFCAFGGVENDEMEDAAVLVGARRRG